MKWLQDNPLGMAMAAISGVLALLALGMAIVWNLPVAVETAEIETEKNGSSDTIVAAHQIAAINNFVVGLSQKLGYSNLASARRIFDHYKRYFL